MMTERKSLAGKTAWVTGSSRGIGRVIADHLASLGVRIAVHGTSLHSTRAFNEADSLVAVADAISDKYAVDIIPVYGDLTDEDTVKRIVADINAKIGNIDILVNCAGGDIGSQGTMGSDGGKPRENDPINISFSDIRSVLDRNLMTCILACREVAPAMMERKSGWIINIGSIAGLAGHINGAIYATAKAGVHEYSRCLAEMLRPYNVTVNVIAPGEIVTARFLASRTIDDSKKITDGTLERYGWPIDVAKTAAFLVSEGGQFITGQVIRVDGGKQLWPA